MLTRRQSLLCLLSLASVALTAPASAAPAAYKEMPDWPIARLYNRILKNPDLPGFGVQKSDQRLLSKSLRAVWARTDAKAKRIDDQMGPLGFDMVTNSQTGDLKSYALTVTENDGRSATVLATFKRGDEYPEHERNDAVEYRLVDENGWKIDDIRGTTDGKEWSLRTLLNNYLKAKF